MSESREAEDCNYVLDALIWQTLLGLLRHHRSTPGPEFDAALSRTERLIERLSAQREALLNGLKHAGFYDPGCDKCDEARAAIAKAESELA